MLLKVFVWQLESTALSDACNQFLPVSMNKAGSDNQVRRDRMDFASKVRLILASDQKQACAFPRPPPPTDPLHPIHDPSDLAGERQPQAVLKAIVGKRPTLGVGLRLKRKDEAAIKSPQGFACSWARLS